MFLSSLIDLTSVINKTIPSQLIFQIKTLLNITVQWQATRKKTFKIIKLKKKVHFKNAAQAHLYLE